MFVLWLFTWQLHPSGSLGSIVGHGSGGGAKLFARAAGSAMQTRWVTQSSPVLGSGTALEKSRVVFPEMLPPPLWNFRKIDIVMSIRDSVCQDRSLRLLWPATFGSYFMPKVKGPFDRNFGRIYPIFSLECLFSRVKSIGRLLKTTKKW